RSYPKVHPLLEAHALTFTHLDVGNDVVAQCSLQHKILNCRRTICHVSCLCQASGPTTARSSSLTCYRKDTFATFSQLRKRAHSRPLFSLRLTAIFCRRIST